MKCFLSAGPLEKRPKLSSERCIPPKRGLYLGPDFHVKDSRVTGRAERESPRCGSPLSCRWMETMMTGPLSTLSGLRPSCSRCQQARCSREDTTHMHVLHQDFLSVLMFISGAVWFSEYHAVVFLSPEPEAFPWSQVGQSRCWAPTGSLLRGRHF